MRIDYKIFSKSSRVAFLVTVLFSFLCLQLCAAENKMTPEQAKKARQEFVETAKSLLGSPYSYGGIGPSEFDCSGFVYYVSRISIKIQLPRTSSAIYDFCTIIDNDEVEEGDLVFFKTTGGNKISHVGIYIGNGEFVSAISDGQNTGVQVRSLLSGYWADAFSGTGQILPSGKTKTEDEQKVVKKEADKKSSNSSSNKGSSEKNTKNKTVTQAPKSSKQESIEKSENCLYDGCNIKECCNGFLYL